MRGTNDIGGLPAGPVDTSAKDPRDWQKTLTAVVNLLGPDHHKVLWIDEFRRARESLPDEVYKRLPYFDLWTEGLALLLVEKGLFTEDELAAKMMAMRGEDG